MPSAPSNQRRTTKPTNYVSNAHAQSVRATDQEVTKQNGSARKARPPCCCRHFSLRYNRPFALSLLHSRKQPSLTNGQQEEGRYTYLHARLVAKVGDDGVVVGELGPLDLEGVLDALAFLLVREVVVESRAVLKLEGAFVGVAAACVLCRRRWWESKTRARGRPQKGA